MCGIAGYWTPGQPADEANLSRMAIAIRHRGPDDHGIWIDRGNGPGLAHRRLAILDLSPAGHQPMASRQGRYVLVFNGEIYNHLELRRSLDEAGPVSVWRGHSDTETLLAAFEAWGIERTLKAAVGMFAFAAWDRAERSLTLGRDRLGEKPIYYGYSGGAFLFGSELKALSAYPSFSAHVDRTALALFMRHNYVPAPYSIYEGIRKLPPGSLLTLSGTDAARRHIPPTRTYWSARDAAINGQAARFTGTANEARTELERLLIQSVRGQKVADVPLGAFLSGGVDSSMVVALMQRSTNQPAKTFTIGFHEAGYNEAEYARAVAKHLGTEHTELYVTSAEALAVIPRIPQLYDEPFADSSQIPTFLVSELARKHVTVSLSGDGGDELFGGYSRYIWAGDLWRKIGWMPQSLRSVMALLLTTLPPESWTEIFQRLGGFLPKPLRQSNAGDKIHKVADILSSRSPDEIYYDLISHWKSPADLVVSGVEGPTAVTARSEWPTLKHFEDRMMYLDLVSYLPDDILAKVDRAAMGVSLETRVPFLDHRVVEFALSLPLAMKIRAGRGKTILREVLYQYVPESLIERPKMGFGVPIAEWLRGPLKDWAEDLIDASRLSREGFIRPEPVRKKWAEHLSGGRNWGYPIWDILMFQAWLAHSHA